MTFAIAGSGVHTISIDAALPTITDGVILDATTQAGGSFSTPLIYLTKSGAYTGADSGAIVITASNTTVSGFIVGGFADEGIEISGFADVSDGDNNIIENNWVGFDASGAANANGDDGILVTSDADGNTIRNNVVGSSGGDGIHVRDDSDNNWVWGNTVGLAVDGSTDRGNAGHGIHISGTTTGNIIGGDGIGADDTAERNIIAGNDVEGIHVSTGSTNLRIAENYIGLDATGTLDRGNAANGIFVFESNTVYVLNNVVSGNDNNGIVFHDTDDSFIQGNIVGLNAAGDAAVANLGRGVVLQAGSSGNLIGGSTAAERNVISGNNTFSTNFSINGLFLTGLGTDDNRIQGNYIGLNAAGDAVISNESTGIQIDNGASNNIIGSDDDGNNDATEGNVIVGSAIGSGIAVSDFTGDGTTGNKIYGNYIGTDETGTADWGNSSPAFNLTLSSTGTIVGGIGAFQANVIANNFLGVFVDQNSRLNTIRGNSIRDNSGLGIALETSSVQDNDNLDSDTGSNDLQNFPTISSVLSNDGTVVQVAGSINSTANTTLTLDFYGNSNGDGEGEYYIGELTVTTDANGDATFDELIFGFAGSGDAITATATDPIGNTSEFSASSVAALNSFAPTDLQTTSGDGLSINNDGGNDIYLQADDGIGSADLTALTYEHRYSTTDETRQALVSYFVAGSDDEFKIVTLSGGGALILVADDSFTISNSTFDFRTLDDGAEHAIAFTWDNSVGDWALYVDGEERTSGTGLAAGQTVTAGGVLVLGNEQDSLGGSFDADAAHQATLFGSRLFGNARTVDEIAASYRSDVPYDEPGLIADWKFDQLSPDGVVIDSVSGNNLTVMHTTEAGFTESEASLTFAGG